MALSGLFEKLTRKKPESPELFFAIQIDTEFVKTAIWTVHENLTEVIAVGSISEWDGSSTQVLVEAIDSSLSIALEKIGEQPEPTRVIFGLPETWVTPDGVAVPRLSDLKTICEKLDLKPLGFVVATEAIVHYLKATEGTPLSAILLRASTSEIAVTVVQLGTIEGTHVAGRSGDLAADVREGLVRFGDRDSFPSRMLLYNGGEDLEDLSQQLLAYDWQSTMPFLHIPKIEPLDEHFSITAIAKAGGGEVAKSLGFTVIEMENKKREETLGSKNEGETTTEEKERRTEREKMEEQDRETIATKGVEGETKEEVIESAIEPTETAEPEPEDQSSSSVTSRRHVIAQSVSALVRTIRRFPTPHIIFPRKSASLTMFFALFLFGGVVFAVVQVAKRVPHATITIEFEGQTVSQRLKVQTGTSIQKINADIGELPAQEVSVKEQAETSKETTGKETTGEKARGKVAIYNRRTDGTKTFSAGTNLTDPKTKRSFTIDADATVASASAGPDYSIVPGKQTVAVTAEGFGPEYNVDSGSEFQIANFSTSTYIAKNDEAFSGGTKRDIQVVSRKDQTALRDELIEKMKDRAKSDIESQAGGKTTFLETMTITVTKESFSAQAGEEASSVSLALEADVTALAIDKMMFHELLVAMLTSFVPDGFKIVPEKLMATVDEATSVDNVVSFETTVSIPATPTIDRSAILKKVMGLRPTLAADAVKTLPHFKRMEVSLAPTLPPFLRWIPVSEDHIDLDIRLAE